MKHYFYPDSIFYLDDISTSSFLFFQNDIFTTSSPLFTFRSSGCDINKFLKEMEEGNYSFKERLLANIKRTDISHSVLNRTYKTLKPLYKKDILKQAGLSYPRTGLALKLVDEIITKSGFTIEQIFNSIDRAMASQELTAHIFEDKFIELYREDLGEIEFVDVNGMAIRAVNEKIDYQPLLEYCEELFSSYSDYELLVRSYLFRLIQREAFESIFISNNNIIPFLNSLKQKNAVDSSSYYDNISIISWEIFRQLTEKHLINKTPANRVSSIIDLRENNLDEIESLKTKCLKLSEQFEGEKDSSRLHHNIAEHIKINTSKEIQDLFKLDKRILENLIDSIFSDHKSWLAFSSFLTSLLTENALFTAASGIATIARIGSKAYKQVSDAEKKINDSEYALIYRLKNN